MYKTATGRFTPRLNQLCNEQKKWYKPKEKRLPFPIKMFEAMQDAIRLMLKQSDFSFLLLLPCIFDWLRLGIFTGCRSGKYCQTVARKGTFSKVPFTASPTMADYAMAFINDDFTFYSRDNVIIPKNLALFSKRHFPYKLAVRFRFQKNGQNNVTRWFTKGQDWLCPIDAAISICYRASMLGVKPHEPLAVYLDKPQGSRQFLRSCEVVNAIRTHIITAFPNPLHYFRQNIENFVAHSNRVTAAVALKSGGMDNADIAFRLRWHIDTVEHYLRECAHSLDALTLAAIKGALLL